MLSNIQPMRVICCLYIVFVSPGDAFTLGTVAVLPFYTLMVAAPKAELVRVYVVVIT